MKVLFGGVEAEGVQVIDDTFLYCFTPVHDAGAVAVELRNLAPTPASLLLEGAEPFSVHVGEDVEVVLGAVVQVETIQPGNLATSGAATAAELAVVANRFDGVSASAEDGRLRIVTDARGPLASLALGGAWGVVAPVSGSAVLVEVPNEHVVASHAYTFARPDLTVRSPIAEVVRQLIVELKRQVLDNVHSGTHSDFDPETGDMQDIAVLAKLPAIVFADVQLTATKFPVVRGEVESPIEAGKSVVLSPNDYRDIQLFLVCVAESPEYTLNIVNAVLEFAKNNASFKVRMRSGCVEAFTLVATSDQTVSLQAQRNSDNIATAQIGIVIYGVPLMGFIPQGDNGVRPADVPATVPYGSVVEVGVPQTGPAELVIVPKSEIDAEGEP